MEPFKVVILILSGAVLASCNTKRAPQMATETKALYFDYEINGAEDKQEVTCILKYRKGGPAGKPIMIDSPGKVSMDGNILQSDSGTKGGVYYEAITSKTEFARPHQIELEYGTLERYKEEFNFQAFTLLEELPEQITRKPFVVKLKNFPFDASLRLVMTDTSAGGNGINEIVKVNNETIGITQYMLDRLKTGPILIKLYLEQERPLKNTMAPGGLLTTYYSLERDFNLE